ncbi:hypothetical protein O181_019587 [Austropuccinia psidii MF-1]|uniref:Integrase catalytic domain-containing protein n=1 Tax=Austropuccinia psidii MF-1 TaxID=1389203 RepID=A0A9Q3CA11_9BASI|nr:hypothetical protein [Austropuccinia psidii MF-1]
MESILTFKNYLGLVTDTETEEERLENDKIEPRHKQQAMALLRISCVVCIAQEYFQPKTIQNQTSYLDKIFSTQFADDQIKEVMLSILENTQQLRSLFSGLTIPPEDLINSVIAMWVIINLPERFKTTMEVWLGKCEVEKKTPSLDGTWEVIRKFLQQQEGNSNEQPNQALGVSRNKPNKNQQYQKKEEKDYPRCSPGWHNPLTKHNKSDCNFLKPDKNRNKPIKSLAVSSTIMPSNQIILDSGATTSMFDNPALFINLTEEHQKVELADGSTNLATGFGNVQVELPHCYLQLKNCLLVKSLAYNLVSLGSIMKPKYKITTLNDNYFNLTDNNGELILSGTYQAGNFEVIHDNPKALASSGELKNDALILHQAAGQPSSKTMTKIYPKLNLTNLQCSVCSACKITKSPFTGTLPIPQQKLHFVHANVFGPIDQPSSSGYRYCLRVVDGFSRLVWTTFLKAKSNVITLLTKVLLRIQNQANLKIANFISDNEQNPLAEKGNQATITKARCLLKHSGLQLSYWAEATRTATYLENLTPKKSLHLSTPFQKWYNKEPSYNHLQPFGCQVFYLNNIQKGKFTEFDNPPINNNLLSESLSDPNPNHDKEEEHSTLIPTNEEEETPPEAKSSKRYKWVPENQPPPKEILGKVGDPQNILQHSRQTHTANAVSLLENDNPKTYSQAMNSNHQQEWQNTIATELENMKKHHVWSPSETIENIKPLSTTWVFKRKTDKDGNLTKFKARLCVRGFNQKEGIDYGDFFSPLDA